MKEKIEEIIKKLRAISDEVGKIPNPQTGPVYDPTEENLDGATDSIQDAIEQLREIISLS